MVDVMRRFAVLGDIGGTNFRLRLCQIADGKVTTKDEVFYETKQYSSFSFFIDQLLDKHSRA